MRPKWLILGRTAGPEGGYAFEWRDDHHVLPDDIERDELIHQMRDHHHVAFGRNPEHAAVVVLPAWKTYDTKLVSWLDGAAAGACGLHVEGDPS